MNPLAKPNLKLLKQRAELLRELRQFFDSRGFLEVQPPCLSADCVVDAFIDPIDISSDKLGLGIDLPKRFYLQTSPEAAMKRMLSAGAPSIYSLGPVFRAGERGAWHNIEFTMLEWYDVDAGMPEGIRLLGDLAASVFATDGFDVIAYRELFQQTIGIDPIGASINLLREMVADIAPGLVQPDRDSLLDILLANQIQPTLGVTRPMIIKNYPISQAALACRLPDDRECAARFELFFRGTELANGYDELQDADVFMQRTAAHNSKRVSTGRHPIRGESALFTAMRQGLPSCCGVAMGVDRLLMIRSGASSIDETIPFPIEIA